MRWLLTAVVVMAITAVGDTLSVASGGYSNVQPASGEVWHVMFSLEGALSASGAGVELFDGTDGSEYVGSTTATNAQRTAILSNSQYGRLKAPDTGARNMGYRGVKL